GPSGNVGNPDFPDPSLRIHLQFYGPVEIERRVANLEKQQNVIRAGVSGFVEILSRKEKADIRFGLAVTAQLDWQLYCNFGPSRKTRDENLSCPADHRPVWRVHRFLADDLSVDEFSMLTGMQDAHFGHPVVVVDGEEFLRCFCLHEVSVLRVVWPRA